MKHRLFGGVSYLPFFAPDGGDTPPPSVTPPAPPAPPHRAPADPPEPETFSKDYVRELRAENKGWRLKAQEQERAAREAEEKATKAAKDAEEKVAAAERAAEERATAAQRAADERTIRAELRTEAIKSGMIDLDGLKLADLSAVKLDENGNVEGAADLIGKLKEGKPYLFGSPRGTSSTETPPSPSPNKPFDAKTASKEEYEAEKRKLAAKHRYG